MENIKWDKLMKIHKPKFPTVLNDCFAKFAENNHQKKKKKRMRPRKRKKKEIKPDKLEQDKPVPFEKEIQVSYSNKKYILFLFF